MRLKFWLIVILLLVSGCDQANDGPLARGSDAKNYGFDTLPPLQNKRADALRVIIQPSSKADAYRFDFLPIKQGCQIWDPEVDGMSINNKNYCDLVMVEGQRTRKQSGTVEQFSFVIPDEDFRELFNGIKHSIDKWRIGTSLVFDGTTIAVELHSRGKVRSYHSNGGGNWGADKPSDLASIFVRAIALAYGPSGIFPRGNGWNTIEDQKFPCRGGGLNRPDPDGFGIGDDVCGKWLTAHPKQQ